MKNRISLITLIVCAAAGTAFAADPVVAFRASSGAATNSSDAIYVGNSNWGADSKTLGETYVADVYTSRGSACSWSVRKNAFYMGDIISCSWGSGGDIEYYTEKEYWSFDTVFALTETATFANDSTMIFQYAGDKDEKESGAGTYLENSNVILLAGSSKFENRGEILLESHYEGSGGHGPRFEVFLRDNAVFENSGTLGRDYDSNSESLSFDLFGNAKLINTKSGVFKGSSSIELYGNSTFENAGTVKLSEPCIAENACFVNTGEVSCDKSIYFEFSNDLFAGTAKLENRGTMNDVDVMFYIEVNADGELPTNVSASFENYGIIFGRRWEIEYTGEDYGDKYNERFGEIREKFKLTLAQSSLDVKNFGTIEGDGVEISSFVKLTLAEGSKIVGGLAFGDALEIESEKGEACIRANKDFLSVVLTGKGGSDPLISGDLELGNSVEFNVSFSEDAVEKTKYVLTVWDGELTINDTDEYYDYGTGEMITAKHAAGFIESSLSGTLSGFGTSYYWKLDTATGVLTAKNVNIREEVDVTSSTQTVTLGPKDVATFDSRLSEYSGSVSGAGEVHSSGMLKFCGDASGLTGTTSIDAGTFTIANAAKLGTGAFDVAGTLVFEGAHEVSNEICGSGTVEIATGATASFKDFGAKTLKVNGTLKGDFELDYDGVGAQIFLSGALALDVDKGEKVDLDGGSSSWTARVCF